MYYHASNKGNLKVLVPNVSNHNIPLVYFSEKRENVLVYLSNAVEKYCKENNYIYDGIWSTWASYSFDKDGILQIEEYYPNAIYETYKGISGYIYSVENAKNLKKLNQIPYVYLSNTEIKVDNVEFIQDAYEEIMNAVKEKKIKILKYENLDDKKKKWIYEVINKEYDEAINHPEYRFFLLNKFKFLKDKTNN